MEPEGALPQSQVPATCPSPEPDQSRLWPPPSHFLKIHLNIILSSMPRSFNDAAGIFDILNFPWSTVSCVFRQFGESLCSKHVRWAIYLTSLYYMLLRSHDKLVTKQNKLACCCVMYRDVLLIFRQIQVQKEAVPYKVAGILTILRLHLSLNSILRHRFPIYVVASKSSQNSLV